MKKNNLLVTTTLMTTVLIIGCAWENDKDCLEPRTAYYQAPGESNDSTSSGIDTTYVARISNGIQAGGDDSFSDSILCNLIMTGKLIVDGGSSTDLSDTYVTVEKIIARIWTDGQSEPVECLPKAAKEVAEPSFVYTWETMPQGLKYARRTLCERPVTFCYMNNFHIEASVCFILRVRETRLAAECTADRYWNTVSYDSDGSRIDNLDILVPLKLCTIQFDAVVQKSK